MFSGVMSEIYKTEVPQYQALTQLVADVNTEVLARNHTTGTMAMSKATRITGAPEGSD
jgi:uncharacterized glyoxalase superfamily metalloenzyme YdcJ